jgi:hypothetical protein
MHSRATGAAEEKQIEVATALAEISRIPKSMSKKAPSSLETCCRKAACRLSAILRRWSSTRDPQ